MIVVVPFVTAVASPAEETVTTVVSDVDHVTVAPEITPLPASFTVAVSVTVSPTDTSVFVLGVTCRLDAAWATVTDAVPVIDPEAAVIVAVPVTTAVTTPVDATVATVVSDEDQVTEAPEIAVPPASFTVALSVTVIPADVSVLVPGETSTVAATCATVTAAVPVKDPEVAVMVAVPPATAVTSPADETVATPEADDDHVTVAPEITPSPASFTVALRVTVSPTDAKVLVVGETSTVAAT